MNLIQATLFPSTQAQKRAALPVQAMTLYFDGGTPCNIPSRGYGIGYGSYQYEGREVVRVNHGRPMSNNAAELWTLVAALRDPNVPQAPLHIVGDSQIALKWASVAAGTHKGKGKLNKNASEEMRDSIAALRELLRDRSVVTEWRARIASVRRFGH